MKELKSYISEGFFTNVGANNIVKPVIDLIKDASINDKIDSGIKCRKFADLLTPTLKDIENNLKKGKIVFEYIRNDGKFTNFKATISLKMTGPGPKDIRWMYSDESGESNIGVGVIAYCIAADLLDEVAYPTQDPKLRHSIANTIKVTEFKLS